MIIGDFLDISHIEQGTMQYDFAPLDVKELAKGLADEFKATIESSAEKSKALKISFEAADEKENFNIRADRNKIRQVISNLIDNSIKYTPSGFVKVSLSKISETGNVLLKIEDSGIGISAETMPNLFKKIWPGQESFQHLRQRFRPRPLCRQRNNQSPQRQNLGGIGRGRQGLALLCGVANRKIKSRINYIYL